MLTNSDVVNEIISMRNYGSKPGLRRVERMLEEIGNPHRGLEFIHVAGTNGKGSTTAMCAAVLKTAGFKTGMFTSPFIDNFYERIQINGRCITDEDLKIGLEMIKPAIDSMQAQGLGKPGQFEVITVIAMWYFAKSQCDIVCLEVGLGGRHDATNIIESPVVSVITQIGLDHTDILGDTIELVAKEKSQIIKSDRPVVCYPFLPQGAMGTVLNESEHRRSPVLFPSVGELKINDCSLQSTNFTYRGTIFDLPLAGPHQVYNCITAIEALCCVRRQGFYFTEHQLKQGIESVVFPGRFEKAPGEPVTIIDGAHNEQGVLALGGALKLLGDKPLYGVCGILEEKNYTGMLATVASFFEEIATVEIQNPRSLNAQVIADAVIDTGVTAKACDTLEQAVKWARAQALENDGAVVIFGSLYLAGEARALLRDPGTQEQSEPVLVGV